MLLLLACCCMLHGCKLTVRRCGAPDGQRGPARDPGMCPDFFGHYHNPCNSLLDFSHNSGVFSKRPAWPLVCLCQPRSSSSSSSCGRCRRRAALLRQPSMPGSSSRVAAPAVFSSYCPSLHVFFERVSQSTCSNGSTRCSGNLGKSVLSFPRLASISLVSSREETQCRAGRRLLKHAWSMHPTPWYVDAAAAHISICRDHAASMHACDEAAQQELALTVHTGMRGQGQADDRGR